MNKVKKSATTYILAGLLITFCMTGLVMTIIDCWRTSPACAIITINLITIFLVIGENGRKALAYSAKSVAKLSFKLFKALKVYRVIKAIIALFRK